MKEVEEFIYALSEDQRELMLCLHHYMIKDKRLTCKIRYKIPFYDQRTWVCYVNPLKNGNVDIAFIRANELKETQIYLDFKKRKQLASITVLKGEEVPVDLLNKVFEEALELDLSKGYKLKRKSK